MFLTPACSGKGPLSLLSRALGDGRAEAPETHTLPWGAQRCYLLGDSPIRHHPQGRWAHNWVQTQTQLPGGSPGWGGRKVDLREDSGMGIQSTDSGVGGSFCIVEQGQKSWYLCSGVQQKAGKGMETLGGHDGPFHARPCH